MLIHYAHYALYLFLCIATVRGAHQQNSHKIKRHFRQLSHTESRLYSAVEKFHFKERVLEQNIKQREKEIKHLIAAIVADPLGDINVSWYGSKGLILNLMGLAIIRRDEATVYSLVQFGANVNCIFNHEESPLFYVVSFYKTNIMKSRMISLFISAGANIEYFDKHNNTSLVVAIQNFDSLSVQLLVDAGADVNTSSYIPFQPVQLNGRMHKHNPSDSATGFAITQRLEVRKELFRSRHNKILTADLKHGNAIVKIILQSFRANITKGKYETLIKDSPQENRDVIQYYHERKNLIDFFGATSQNLNNKDFVKSIRNFVREAPRRRFVATYRSLLPALLNISPRMTNYILSFLKDVKDLHVGSTEEWIAREWKTNLDKQRRTILLREHGKMNQLEGIFYVEGKEDFTVKATNGKEVGTIAFTKTTKRKPIHQNH